MLRVQDKNRVFVNLKIGIFISFGVRQMKEAGFGFLSVSADINSFFDQYRKEGLFFGLRKSSDLALYLKRDLRKPGFQIEYFEFC